jgi:capsule polysaccharide export protein KpsE/RkpR
MIEKFNLLERYGAESMTDAVEMLAEKTIVDKTEDGTILIAVLDQDPQTAADMAMHYTVILDKTNKNIAQITASERLLFIRSLLNDEDEKLEVKMKSLQEFQSEHNAIAIEDQARAVITAAAAMQTDAMELEIIRQGFILSGLDENHDKVKKLKREILLRQEAMTFLREGIAPAGSGDPLKGKTLRLEIEQNLFLPLREIPNVAQEYAKLEKDVMVQKALLQLLLQQEAEALIEAKNTTSTVQILDPAVPAEIKAKPQRLLIVFIVFVLSLFASICYTLGGVYVHSLKARWKAEYGARA